MKQGQDHDPDAAFIARWVPELAHLPPVMRHQPWRLPVAERGGYPCPLVDHAVAVREARARVTALRRRPEVQEAIQEVVQRHGSRARSRRGSSRPSSRLDLRQGEFFFGN